MVKSLVFFVLRRKSYVKTNDKNIINNDDDRNDIYNAAVNGLCRRNKGADSKCI